MIFKTFQSYCEAQDATVAYVPNTNSNFTHPQNKSFEQTIDPLIRDFANKILTNALSENNLQLEPIQIEYIMKKVKEEVSNLQYNPKDDLGQIVNNIYRKSPSIETPNNKSDSTPLAHIIDKLTRKNRRT